MTNINDLPEEVLEFIFSILPPYKDLQEISLVCKRWSGLAKSKFRCQPFCTSLFVFLIEMDFESMKTIKNPRNIFLNKSFEKNNI